jgi:formamidopyrimidine-DNA glycosylase
MPELPEVETIRRELEPAIVGRELGEAWAFLHPKFVPALEATDTTVVGTDRKGKFLLLALDDDRELVIHLGMTGSLQIRPRADAEGDPYSRAWWELDGGPDVLAFRDVRRFGRLRVVPKGDYEGTLAVQGPDALDPSLTADDFWRSLKASRRAVKTQLLSQRPLAGVGNIYADEALWQVGVHPQKRTVTRAQATALLAALQDVLRAGVDNGGTTLRDYRDFSGREGDNQRRLSAYGRYGLPCVRCGTELRRTIVDARATTFCPTCQRR